MADHSEFVALANEMLGEDGMEMVFLHLKQDGKIDPVTGKRPVTVMETRFMGLVTRPTKDETAAGRFQNVTKVVLAAGDAIRQPAISDKLRFLGHDWEIREILEIAPAGVPVIYKFGVRDAGLL